MKGVKKINIYLTAGVVIPFVKIDGGDPIKMMLPEGCIGVSYAFKTKTSARKFMGKDVELICMNGEETERQNDKDFETSGE